MTDISNVIFALTKRFADPVFYTLILLVGVAAVRRHLRAENPRRAVIAAFLTVAVVAAVLLQRTLPLPLQSWLVVLLQFGASIYFGVWGWTALTHETVVTPAFKYVLAGLLGSVILLALMFLVPRQFATLLILLSILTFAGILAWEWWTVRKRPAIDPGPYEREHRFLLFRDVAPPRNLNRIRLRGSRMAWDVAIHGTC